MGLMLAPVGAVIVTEHWIFPRIGFTRYWNKYRGNTMNIPAVATWFASLALAYYLETSDTLHLFFILTPVWIFATILYVVLASFMGAREQYEQSAIEEQQESLRKQTEVEFLATQRAELDIKPKDNVSVMYKLARMVTYLSLVVCAGMGIAVYMGSSFTEFKAWLILPTVIYFVAATVWICRKESA